MAKTMDPNPPSRKDEDFPKTTTIPEGWVADELTDYYNRPAPASDNGKKPDDAKSKANGNGSDNTRPSPVVDDETLFTRRLDSFPNPNTIPNGWDVSWI